jgi:putative ABC transport system permease protein
MRPALRLATSNISSRRSRSVLLVAVIAMSAMLISAVGVALSSLCGAIQGRVEAVIGSADLQIKPTGRGGVLDESILEVARSWPETRSALGRLDATISLRFGRLAWKEEKESSPRVWRRKIETYATSGIGVGIDPRAEGKVRAIKLLEGRLPQSDDEIVLDKEMARRLGERHASALNFAAPMSFIQKSSAVPTKADLGPETVSTAEEALRLTKAGTVAVGDKVQLIRFQKTPIELTVVGIAAQPPLGGNPQGYMTIPALQLASAQPGKLSQVSVITKDRTPESLNALVERRKADLPSTALLQTSSKITSGLNKNLETNQLAFVIVSMLAFLAASFIIMTGMSTGVAERTRELGVFRCVGASRGQLAETQLLTGLMLGVTGASIGVPLGMLGAAAMVLYFQDRIGTELNIEVWRLAFAFLGATAAAVLGAAFPAWQASRVSPLQALASRSVPPRRRTTAIIAALGLLGVLVHLCVFTLFSDGNVVFYSYLGAGLPGLLGGYFLLGVPAVLIVVFVFGRLIERALSIPRHLLTRGIRGTPYRFGFTAGAMMLGLGLMVAIWTQGGASLRDWVEKIEFPDAFVVGFNLSPESQTRLEELPFVKATSSVAMQTVETDAFGLRGRMKLKTYFIAFEPKTFFEMNRLEWVQGDPATAIRRIEQGGAVIVAREYLTAKGIGVGSVFSCKDSSGNEHSFDVVGVVASPGLDIIGDSFDIGAEFQEQRLHSVFGGRKDLKEHFGNDTVGLIQIDLDDAVDDEVALQGIREALIGSGVLNAGSGRQIKREITGFVRSAMLVSSLIAAFAMFVSCFGVANLIVAGVQARQFEFGVLRALGGTPRLLTRLVVGEAIVIAIAACVLGTLFGVQGAFGGARLNELLWGLDITPQPPVGPILAGWAVVLLMCVLAALPTAMAVARKGPRELLATMRG